MASHSHCASQHPTADSWRGYYEQIGQRYELRFDNLHIDGHGKITGSGKDDIGTFTISGSAANNGDVLFHKQYHGKHSVKYSGRINHGHSIDGSWEVPGFSTGKYHLEAYEGSASHWKPGIATTAFSLAGTGHKPLLTAEGKVGCCPPGALGPMKPVPGHKGSEVLIDGNINLYHVGSGPKAILMISDCFGLDSGRSRLVADDFASRGYQVFFPDLFHGKPFPDNGSFDGFIEWARSFPITSIAHDIMTYVVPFAKTRGVRTFGLVGFCWGTWVLSHLCVLWPDFRAAVHPHPSFQLFSIQGEDGKDVLSRVTVPQLYLPTSQDEPGLKPNGELINLLKKRLGIKAHSVEIPEVPHGFFVRSDLRDPASASAYLKAMNLTVDFLSKYL